MGVWAEKEQRESARPREEGHRKRARESVREGGKGREAEMDG